MIMKKLFLFLVASLFLVSCGEDANVTGSGENTGNEPSATARTTEVYVQGQNLAPSTRAVSDNTETAHFFLRIDNRIPDKDGNHSYPSNLYWPKKAGNTGDVTVIAKGNEGTIDMSYPYWTISGSSRYIYDSTGMSVTNALKKIPSWSDLIAANEDHTKGVDDIDFSKYKVIWYVIKKENNGWHVDGVLTLLDTKDVNDIPGITITEDKKMENSKKEEPEAGLESGNVEVDIHEQLHKDWDEVKTSIHVRDLVDEVKVEIPIEQENMAPSDDFAIRTYDYALESKVYIKGKEYDLGTGNPIKVTVEHQTGKLVITIMNINHEYIKGLQEQYGDGITVEVHSYPRNLSKDVIFNKIKQSTVTVLPAGYDASKVKVKVSKYDTTEEE